MASRIELPMFREPIPESEKVHEECGVVMIYNFDRVGAVDLFSQARIAGKKVQHRGQHGGGVVIGGADDVWRLIGDGPLDTIFTDENIAPIQGLGIPDYIGIQTRYGTSGGYEVDKTAQPCISLAADETLVSGMHNGQFTNVAKMRESLKDEHPEGVSDSYIFTHMIAEAKGETWDEKVLNTLDKVEGAYCVTVMIGDTVYVARDKQGMRPFVIGTVGENNIIVASETVATDSVGARDVREVKRGEVLKIDKAGVTTLREGGQRPEAHCGLEREYFEDEESDYFIDGQRRSIKEFRRETGRVLAREFSDITPDIVIGVPKTGMTIGRGFAEESNAPYEQLIIKRDEKTVIRAFQQDHDLDDILRKVGEKLLVDEDRTKWEGKRVAIGDDSIFRGNVSAYLAHELWQRGATGVDFLSGFPMVTNTCHLGVSLRTQRELIAFRNDRDPVRIAQEIKRTAGIPEDSDFEVTVNYISLEGFIQAMNPEKPIVIPDNRNDIGAANGLCMGCTTPEARYPVSPDGEVMIFEREREMVAA